jgi:hypothetical protein
MWFCLGFLDVGEGELARYVVRAQWHLFIGILHPEDACGWPQDES